MAAEPFKSGGTDVPEITASELHTRLESGEALVLLDVREAFERRIADLPNHGQLRIPVAEVGERVDELDPTKRTVVYCRSGSRSAAIVRYLGAQGFDDVLNLKGGILAWRSEVDPSLRAY